MNEIFHRTSIRTYKQDKVEQEKIIKILKAAMAAPSAGNQQPWEYYVVSDHEVLNQLSKTSPYASCVKNAPMAFVACYRSDCDMPEYAPIDLSASVENMLLEADHLGLGAVWLGIAPLEERMKAVKQVIGIADRVEPFAIIPCGYPAKNSLQQDRFDQSKIHYVG